MHLRLIYRAVFISTVCILAVRSECNLMKFHSKDIVSEIIPKVPSNPMEVVYNNNPVDCGHEIPRSWTLNPPSIDYPADNAKLYTLIMFDPDVLTPQNPEFGPVRHWLVENIPGSDVSKGNVVTKYLQPKPPRFSEPHRYILLAYEQGGKLDDHFSDDFRTNFDFDGFVNDRSLKGPIAGYFYFARYSLTVLEY